MTGTPAGSRPRAAWSSGRQRLHPWLKWAAGLSPAVFLVHDLEEWINVERWPPLPGPLQEFAGAPDPATFAWAIGLLFAIQAGAAAGFLRRPDSRALTVIFAVLAAARLINGVTHVARSALAGAYLPGLWTALVVAVPFAFLLLVGAGRRLGLGGVKWALLLVAGAAIQLPVILASLAFGQWAAGQ